MTITKTRLKEAFTFDATTGRFVWLAPVARNMKPGMLAGKVGKSGYRYVGLDGRLHLEHRLVWLLTHGQMPAGEIDHINGNRADNRPENLRDVTASDNRRNQRRAMRTNRAGLLGAHFHRHSGLFHSSIRADGRVISLGYHKTAEAAHEAYKAAKRVLHSTCTI